MTNSTRAASLRKPGRRRNWHWTEDEDLDFVNTDVRYLLDQDTLFSKFYQAEVPQVNPSVAKQIIQKKSEDDGTRPARHDTAKLEDEVIDQLEYMVLKDTQVLSFQRKDQTTDWKDQTGKKAQGKFTRVKKNNANPILNPYWLVHFSNLIDPIVEQNDNILSTTNLHKNVWNQLNQYLDYLIINNLDNEYVKWKIKPNQYQIGNLSYTYWG